MILRERHDGTAFCRIPHDFDGELTVLDPEYASGLRRPWRCILNTHVVAWLDQQGIAFQQNPILRKNAPSDVRVLFPSVADAIAFKFRFG